MDRRSPPPPSKGSLFDSEPPSSGDSYPTSIVSRIDELRAAGLSLDTVLREARRFVLRTARLRRLSRSVLVVDDADDFRELCLLELRALDFRAEEAVDGAEAFDKAIALQPDAILMDFAMPKTDGGEAVRRLTEDERTRRTPILMVSAFAERIPRDVRHRCAGFVSKPCDCEQLAAVLHVIIDGHRGPASSSVDAAKP